MLQIEPGIASGMPLAVGPPGGMVVIIPVSGGPDRPGERTTEQPIVTGGPGISCFPFLRTRSPEFSRAFRCGSAAGCEARLRLAVRGSLRNWAVPLVRPLA